MKRKYTRKQIVEAINYWQKYLDENFNVYEPPYTLAQIKQNYPDKIYQKLLNDPVHRWRAESGIELIHKEPTFDEFQRIYKNWQLMTPEQKKLSDSKSIEIFGVDNITHYKQLLKTY